MDTVLVGKVAGNAWVRQADGSLLALREGMRVPANAEVVTDSGASVQLQGDGMQPITLGENRQLQVSDELANNDVDPSAQTVPAQVDPTAARVLAALQAGEDPFEQLDPTAAVNSGAGGDDGGSSFTRLASIIEPTTPLALAYPKPIRPEEELPRLGGYGRNNDPEYTLPADLDLKQVNNDSETVTGLNIGQYFSDPDGHSLTFTATGLPPGLTIDPNTGVISGTLDRSASQGGQGGVYTVVVTAKDPFGGSVDLPFTWTALNPPPEAADDHGTTEENTVLEVPKEKGLLSNDVDPDGDDLVVTEIENADGLRVSPGTPITGSNGGTLVVKPDGSYTFTPGKDFDYLAEGETTTVVFEYTISDGEGGTDKAKLVITITGSNDAPVISGVGTDGEGTVVEIKDGEPGEKVDDLTVDGKITFTDVDASDTHTATVKANPEAGQAFLGELTLGAIDPVTKELTWTFTVNDADVDYLAAGEKLVQKYTVTITDDKGGVATQEVVITIIGTNDAPEIDANKTEATGEVIEIKDGGTGENVADLSTGGKIAFTDVDVADTHTATVKANPEAGQTFLGELTLGAIDPVTKELTWTFTVNDADVDYLAAGETLVQKYTVTIADGKGGFATQEIVVTIVGSNDAPIMSGVVDGAVTEDGTLTTSGQLDKTDVDLKDTHEWYFGDKSGTTEADGQHGKFTIDQNGKWTYELNNDDPKVQALGEGETLTETIEVTVDDGNGGTDTKTITVTIKGTNDVPVATEATGNVVESGVKDNGSQDPNAAFEGTKTATGNLVKDHVTDVDANDTLTIVGVSLGDKEGTVATDGSITLEGIYGTLVIAANGTYTYTLDNTRKATQSLTSSDKVKEVFTYTVSDGLATDSSTLTINVQGTNDRPEISDTSKVEGQVVEAGHDQDGKPVAGKSIASGVLVGTDVDDGHTAQLTWHLKAGGVVQEGDTQTITTQYGTLTLDSKTGHWEYELDNNSEHTQKLGVKDTPTETFTVLVRDPDGAWRETTIKVNIQGTNDAPTVKDHLVNFDEDPKEGAKENSKVGNVLDGSENPEGGELTVISFTVGGQPYTDGDVGKAVPVTVDGHEVGTFVINKDGSYEFTPKPDYSGEVPPITYVVQEPNDGNETGLTAEGKLIFTINPVADAPKYTADKTSVTVNEDEWVPLGLTAPEVTDKIDHNGTGAGDNPELLGAIHMRDLPLGSVLRLSDGTTITMTEKGAVVDYPDGSEPTIVTSPAGTLKVVLTDGSHISGLDDSSYLKITSDQFTSIEILPPADSSDNFTVRTEVTSYEVDDHGFPLPKADGPDGLNGATTKVDVYVGVQAVTDPVELSVDGQKEGSSTILMKEDTPFDIAALLSINYPNVDGNDQPDHDGSEKRWFEISGLPKGSMVNGVTVEYDGQMIKIDAPGLSGEEQSMPEITITPPHNFSGKIEGVKVTLKAQDQDKDGTDGKNATHGETLESSITLTLDVDPVADHLEIGEQKGYEDSLIPLLSNVKLGDEDGSEKLTALTIKNVPADWVIRDAQGEEFKPTGTDNGMNSYKLPTNADGVVDLDAFKGWTAQPPAQSSTNGNFKLEYTVEDHKKDAAGNPMKDANGDPIIDTQDFVDDLTITVIPVAERVGTNEPGHSDLNHGLTMTGGHDYSQVVAGTEDTAFALNVDGFDLGAGWYNPDAGSERTFALLKPILVDKAHEDDSAVGAIFTYTDKWGKEHEVRYNGEENGVSIPMEYLGSVTFTPPADVAGKFDIRVQARTVDTKEDDPSYKVEAISGEAWLKGISILPVADGIQAIAVSPAHGKEDSGISLFINPTSKDPSETFNVRISDLPKGSTLTYGGQDVEIIDGVATIKDFDSSKSLVFTALEDASGKFNLKVQAQTEDKWGDYNAEPSEWSTPKTLSVDVKGVADLPTLELEEPKTYTEGELDGHETGTPGAIELKDIVKEAELTDTDGSETLSFKISGLPEGFWVEGATFSGGKGGERVWTFTKDQLANVKIHTPEHFSGNLPGSLTAIATEKDGDSISITKPFGDVVVITPTPETNAALTGGATFNEDTKGNLDFTLKTQANGDDNEEVSAVYLDLAQLAQFAQEGGLQLSVDGKPIADSGLAVEVIDGKSYYKIPQDLLGSVTAKAGANFAHNDGGSFKLNIKFDVIDHSNDGKLTSDPVQFDGEYPITVTPVTDELSGEWTAEDPDNSVKLSNSGESKVSVSLTKHDDTDGSEQLTQFVIDGVPNGVVVTGVDVGNGKIGSATLVGPGKWIVTLTEGERPSFGAGGKLNVSVILDANKGHIATATDVPFSVTAISQDKGAENTESAKVEGKVSIEGTTGGEEEILNLSVSRNPDFAATEDTVFTLDGLLQVDVELDSEQTIAEYSIVLKVPEGTKVKVPDDVTGFQASVDGDGKEVWVIKVTGTPADLADALGQIEVKPPQDYNSNKEGDFAIDASVNVVLPSGKQASDEVDMDHIPVVPQTDNVDVAVDFYTVDEGKESGPQEGKDLGVSITVTNGVDSFIVVGDKVLLKANVDGTFLFNGTALDKEGDYWVLPLNKEQKELLSEEGGKLELDLVFTPATPLEGGQEISLEVSVQTNEKGALNEDGSVQLVTSTGTGKEIVEVINNGYDIVVGTQEVDGGNFIVNGKEVASDAPDGAIKLDITGGLLDAKEAVYSVRLDNLPNDFLVYYKDASGNIVLATNADGMWAMPVVNGDVPDIFVLPPKHWSGTLSGLELTVLSGEPSLKDKDQNESSAKFDLVIAPVADGIASLEASAAFGVEGEIVRLNLNLTMIDRVDASVKDHAGNVVAKDESQETVSLEFGGLGEHAAFYTKDADGKWVLLDEGQIQRNDDGSYVLSGLTQEQVLNLGLVQSGSAIGQNGKVQIAAWTEEGNSSSERVTGEFDLQLSAQQSTAEGDNLLFDGKTLLDGGAGDDTVWLRFGENINFGQDGEAGEADQPKNLFKNIEAFDLTREGFDHAITNLSLQDVLDITDGRNALTIRADHGDRITLGDGWVKDESKSEEGKTIAFKAKDGSEGELLIESTDAELLKAVAESLKDKSY